MTTPSSEDKTVAEAMDPEEVAIDEFVADYEFYAEDESGTEATHSPTEFERVMIKDAIMGLLADDGYVDARSRLIADAAANAVMERRTALAASGSKVDWAALKPSTGVNYAQGLWSRRNWEALVADQLAAAPAEQSAAMPEWHDALDAARYRWLRSTDSRWATLFHTPVKWESGAWAQLGSRWVKEHFDRAVDEARGVAPAAVKTKGKDGSPSGGAIPAVLFDGYTVLQALDKRAQARTSPENVSDVLDAVVRLLRAAHAEQSAAMPEGQTQAARDVLSERQRQVSVEGWTPKHDDEHGEGEMAQAAAVYANPEIWNVFGASRIGWPWDASWYKPRDPRSNYVRAAALLLAEIERLDRAAPAAAQTKGKDDSPSGEADPLDTPLPCRVELGGVSFGKGVALRTLVNAASRWREEAFGPKPTPEEAARALAVLQGTATPQTAAPAAQPEPVAWIGPLTLEDLIARKQAGDRVADVQLVLGQRTDLPNHVPLFTAAPPPAAQSDEALDAARYRWLRDVSVPPHNFYISVPIEFDGVRYTPDEVDAAIDAALAQKGADHG